MYCATDGQTVSKLAQSSRYLGWEVPDPKTGELVRWPAEAFGALME